MPRSHRYSVAVHTVDKYKGSSEFKFVIDKHYLKIDFAIELCLGVGIFKWSVWGDIFFFHKLNDSTYYTSAIYVDVHSFEGLLRYCVILSLSIIHPLNDAITVNAVHLGTNEGQ